MEDAINAVLLGLASGEPVLLLGPPGTAKTQLVEALAGMVGARYFYYLLHRFTEPDELLGPLDIGALREGRYERITRGRLPEAEIVFLDEVFKGSSAVRNLLLDIILHKRVLVGTEYRRIPMLAFYTASNEVSTDAEDRAFTDRLTIKTFTSYTDPEGLLRTIAESRVPPRIQGLLEEARRIQGLSDAWVKKLAHHYTGEIAEIIRVVQEALGRDISNRLRVKTLKVASALALMWGQVPSASHYAVAITYTAPLDPSEKEVVEKRLEALESTPQSITASIEYELARIEDNAGDRAKAREKLAEIRKTLYALPRYARVIELADRLLDLEEEVNG